MRLFKTALVAALIATACAGCATTAADYDACMAKAMEAGLDSAGVVAAVAACRAAHPQTAPDDRALTLDEIVNLTGEAGLSYGNWPGLEGQESYYSGSLHNANDGIRVTELEVTVATAIEGDTLTRAYRDTVSIEPGQTGEFGFNVEETGDAYRWYISGARGTAVR